MMGLPSVLLRHHLVHRAAHRVVVSPSVLQAGVIKLKPKFSDEGSESQNEKLKDSFLLD